MTLYQCEICSRSFKRNEHLTRHKRSHYADRPFTCPVCVRSFTRQDSLLRHLSSHAKAPTRSNEQKQLDKAADTKNTLDPSDRTDEVPENPAPIPQSTGANDAPSDHVVMFGMAQITPRPNAEHEPDIDVPPELSNPLHDANEFVKTPSALERFPSDSTTECYSPTESSYNNRRSNSQTINTMSPGSLSGSFEWPQALYSNTVDRQARDWLRDLCSQK